MTFDEIIDAINIKPYYLDREYGQVIYCADCREILPLIPDKSIDLVLTDPPYGVSSKGVFNIPEKNYIRICESWDVDIVGLTKEAFMLMEPLLNDGASIYSFASFHNLRLVWDVLEASGLVFRNNIPILKTNAMPIKFASQIGVFAYSHEYALYFSKGKVKVFNYEYLKELNKGKQARDYLTITMFDRASNGGKHSHPSIKPSNVVDYFILASSNPSDLILDPFLGSGTTAYCARKLNRKCIGIEIEEKYCEIAAKRCSQSVMRLEV